MGQGVFRFARNVFFGIFAVLLLGALTGAGWYYLSGRVADDPPLKPKPSPAGRAAAVIALAPSTTAAAIEPTSTPERLGKRPVVEMSVQPLEQFSKDLRSGLVKELAAAYPQISDLNPEANGLNPDYRNSAFEFLSAAENAPAAQKPAMLLAADFVLAPVWCPSEYKEKCDPVRKQFADHNLSFPYAELAGGAYYRHDLLWRIWQDFPASEWGERAFVLLLSFGWDPSGTCSKGSDQFREVIRQGESFLEQHPNSPNRGFVAHLVGQAYATWWSLSNQPTPGTEDYIDPKLYHEGSEQARLKAIAYFEQVLQLSPDTSLGAYSRQVLPPLREQQLTSDDYRFFCVYD